MKKAAGYLGYIMVILLIAAAVFTLLAPHFGWRVDAVFSGSMEPKLKIGGVAVTRPVAAEDIKVGDIITFRSPLNEEVISHRVVAVEDGSPFNFQTKGDANEDADLVVVPPQSVVGKVCFHLPYFGYAAQFIKTPLGLLLTLCLPGLVIIILEMRNIWRALAEAQIERKYRMW